MAFALAPAAHAVGYGLHVIDTIPSTSAEALDRARGGVAGPAWFVAREQTQGRGRRGATWQTGPGNLAATLLLTTPEPPSTIATLGFVAGLALVRALEECCAASGAGLHPGPRDEEAASRPAGSPADVRAEASRDAGTRFALKWPNDVLADDAKLAGILLGTEDVPLGRRAVAIGIGVNVAAAPTGLPHPATSLRELGYDVTAERLFGALTGAWLEVSGVWDEGRGFHAVRRLWLARAAGLGGDVAVATAAGRVRGTFETIDDRGQLVLRAMDGAAHRVSAGEVYFGAAATVRGVDA